MSRIKKRTRGEELLGWLQMQKVDGTSTETISVYERGTAIYLIRYFRDGRYYRHLLHPAAAGLIEEAALVWDDLTVQGSSFRSVHLGYPDTQRK